MNTPETHIEIDDLRNYGSFTTKEEYLAYRKSWKHAYAALSTAIRNVKLHERAQASHNSVACNLRRRPDAKPSRFAKELTENALYFEQTRVIEAVATATGMLFLKYSPSNLAKLLLEQRKQSKVRAGEQRAATLARKEAA